MGTIVLLKLLKVTFSIWFEPHSFFLSSNRQKKLSERSKVYFRVGVSIVNGIYNDSGHLITKIPK